MSQKEPQYTTDFCKDGDHKFENLYHVDAQGTKTVRERVCSKCGKILTKCEGSHDFTDKIHPRTNSVMCNKCETPKCSQSNCNEEMTRFGENLAFCEDHYNSVSLTKCAECGKETPFCYGCGSKRGACNDVVCKDCLDKRAKKSSK